MNKPDWAFDHNGELWGRLPEHMHQTLDLYVRKGVAPGHFMTALFANDFMAAIGRADEKNQSAIIDWARFIYNAVPSNCWGSTERVQKWVEQGGIEGKETT